VRQPVLFGMTPRTLEEIGVLLNKHEHLLHVEALDL
jgi:hypothetical protein